jgi:hypothetical protein
MHLVCGCRSCMEHKGIGSIAAALYDVIASKPNSLNNLIALHFTRYHVLIWIERRK